MARKSAIDTVLIVVLAAVLLTGTWYLMSMRFKAGDVYPAYSSLRADPLGSKALHDAFEHLESISVRRHYKRIDNLIAGKGDTVLILGARAWDVDVMEKDLDRLAADGARVVVALKEHNRKGSKKERQDEADSAEGAVEEDVEDIGEEIDPVEGPEAEKPNQGSWNFGMKVSGAVADSVGRYYPVLGAGSDNLPGKITLTSPVYFHGTGEKWRAIYSFDEGPVVIERTIGLGTVVLLSDSYPVSNEALKWELYPRLLSWLLSGSENVVFMEYHLGVRETQGVVTLIRRYRLITLLLCFAVVALLAVWKNAVPLVRVPDKTVYEGGYIVSEKDQFTGFVSLLKRNIGTGSIVQVCLREVRKGLPGSRKGRGWPEGSLEEFSRLASGEKDPVKAYNRITRKLSERTKG